MLSRVVCNPPALVFAVSLGLSACDDGQKARPEHDAALGAAGAAGGLNGSAGQAAGAGGSGQGQESTGGTPSVGGSPGTGGGTPRAGGAVGASGSAPDASQPSAADCPVELDEGPLFAFPGAEGYGRDATGARGGEVYEVTTLDASGPGSLADAFSLPGRTVVFRVAGTIRGNFTAPDNTTIAGQTAPGDGIAIHGRLSHGSNVIIRYLRVRSEGTGTEAALGEPNMENVMMDHLSASWSRGEVLSLHHGKNVTVQWSLVAEACPTLDAEPQRLGAVLGNDHGTYHHNMFVHNYSHNPLWVPGSGHNDFRNNVIYNWGEGTGLGGEAVLSGADASGVWINMVGNYFKPGPGTNPDVMGEMVRPSSSGGLEGAGSWWVQDNEVAGDIPVTHDNWSGVIGTYLELDAEWDSVAITEESPGEAYRFVLADAGCSLPQRDALDARLVEEVRTGTAAHGDRGFISCPADTVLPDLSSDIPPTDSDHDGMPDEFEARCGLDPMDPADRNGTAGDGYTMLEKYLNSIDSL